MIEVRQDILGAISSSFHMNHMRPSAVHENMKNVIDEAVEPVVDDVVEGAVLDGIDE